MTDGDENRDGPLGDDESQPIVPPYGGPKAIARTTVGPVDATYVLLAVGAMAGLAASAVALPPGQSVTVSLVVFLAYVAVLGHGLVTGRLFPGR